VVCEVGRHDNRDTVGELDGLGELGELGGWDVLGG
jgi:hypothetical protein